MRPLTLLRAGTEKGYQAEEMTLEDMSIWPETSWRRSVAGSPSSVQPDMNELFVPVAAPATHREIVLYTQSATTTAGQFHI